MLTISHNAFIWYSSVQKNEKGRPRGRPDIGYNNLTCLAAIHSMARVRQVGPTSRHTVRPLHTQHLLASSPVRIAASVTLGKDLMRVLSECGSSRSSGPRPRCRRAAEFFLMSSTAAFARKHLHSRRCFCAIN